MIFTVRTCPVCGEPVRGTLEALKGCALLTEPDANGKCAWAGETEIWWDEQRTVMDADGCVTLLCPNGHAWLSACDDRPA
jgi:hypothetical protein